jgi:hypothetical protein
VGAGEANFLSGVAKKHGVKDFDVILAKKRFFQIYVETVPHLTILHSDLQEKGVKHKWVLGN